MTEGRATTPQRFWKFANRFGFTFNWAYTSRRWTSFFSSGLLPIRARGLDRRLPTLGTGSYEWRGFLPELAHPHDIGGPNSLLLNWNNKAAPGYMHGDDDHYGSVQHVELFGPFPKHPQDQRRRRRHEQGRHAGRHRRARLADHPRDAQPWPRARTRRRRARSR